MNSISSGGDFSKYLYSYLDPYYCLAIFTTFPLSSLIKLCVSSFYSAFFCPPFEPLLPDPIEPVYETGEFADYLEQKLEFVPFLFFLDFGINKLFEGSSTLG